MPSLEPDNVRVLITSLELAVNRQRAAGNYDTGALIENAVKTIEQLLKSKADAQVQIQRQEVIELRRRVEALERALDTDKDKT